MRSIVTAIVGLTAAGMAPVPAAAFAAAAAFTTAVASMPPHVPPPPAGRPGRNTVDHRTDAPVTPAGPAAPVAPAKPGTGRDE